MKNNRRKFLKLTCISSFLALCVCSCNDEKDHFDENYEVNTTISFDQLKEVACDVPKVDDFVLSKREENSEHSRIKPIYCHYSHLYSFYDFSTSAYVLRNADSNTNISFSLNTTLLDCSTGSLNIANGVAYSTRFPAAVYCVDIGDNYVVSVIDCYGNLLNEYKFSKPVSTINVEMDSSKLNEFWISVDSQRENYYYEYEIIDGKNILKVTRENSNEEVVSLKPNYDRNGEIFAYTLEDDSFVSIYDEDKEFLNTVNIDSFFKSEPELTVRFEKKICYFDKVEYYDNASERSSEKTYKYYCLQINLENGEVSYDDDFRYEIVDSNVITNNDGNYKCTVFKYYKINEKREKEHVLLCSIAKESLSFKNSFVYDNFDTGDGVFKLNDKTILYSPRNVSGYFLCTKSDRTYISDFEEFEYASEDKIIIEDSNNKNVIVGREEFAKNPNIIKEAQKYDYISPSIYNGHRITFTDTSAYDNLISFKKEFKYLAKEGIFVTNKSIILGGTVMAFSCASDEVITDVQGLIYTDKTTFLEISYGNSKTAYFWVDKTVSS